MKSLRDNRIENQHCVGINTLPPRATFIPAQKEGVLYANKEESDRIQSLNGIWDFIWKPDNLPLLPEDRWGSIDVPSVWQYRGYGKCLYPNVEYPIPFTPPYVCAENPVGYYRRRFSVDASFENTLLHFAGVDNAYEVTLNGSFVGFAKGSRIPHEFDVTALLKQGENILEVKVYAFSDATFLENQDMLLASGIFRDVFLIFRRQAYLHDFFLSTDRKSISLSAVFGGETDGCVLEAEADGQTKTVTPEHPECRFEIQNPREWNAEDPQTYTVLLRLKKNGTLLETVTKIVGLRDAAVEGNRFLLNGKPIRFRGINRHEYDPDNGRAISVPFIRRELELMKANNINSVRCSHYTNNPAFYEFCTELGIYVMDEADIETHGCGVTGDQGFLSKSPEWLDAYLDRVTRMAERDKNESCIVIWSIGNECGRGRNIEECARYLRNFCCLKPILQAQDSEGGMPLFSDFRQRGYQTAMPPALVNLAVEGPPVVMTEYEHGMGNGPGSLDEIWDYIYSHEQFAGGWAWEFKGHGFHTVDENGRDSYLYGGDFGDINSWSNFTLDGYLFSDGTPKPAMRELKEVYGPVRIREENGQVIAESTRDFASLKDLTVSWTVTADGHPISSGSFPCPDIPARAEGPLMALPELPDRDAEYRLDLVFTDGTGMERAARQVEMRTYQKPELVPQKASMQVRREGKNVCVTAENFCARFSSGLLCGLEKDGEALLEEPMQFNLYRAPTDNDGIVNLYPRHISEWNEALLWNMAFHALEDEIIQQEDGVRYCVKGQVVPSARCAGFSIHMEYRVLAGGIVTVEINGVPFGNQMPATLPRIGVCFPMSRALDTVTWYGRGWDENYSDRHFSTPFGIYSFPVEKLNVKYDVPQECGNREDTRWVSLENKISFVGSDAFAFSYHDFTQENLTKARHKNELEKADRNYLYLDYKMRGMGSRSCGPDPLEQYELRPHAYRLTFAVVPGGTELAEQLSRVRFAPRTEATGKTFCRPAQFSQKELGECRE